jgi:hypothetical protein
LRDGKESKEEIHSWAFDGEGQKNGHAEKEESQEAKSQEGKAINQSPQYAEGFSVSWVAG